MSYFDSIVVPGTATPKKKSGNFFDQITLPANQAQANKIFDLQHEQQIAERQSAYDNSFSGTVKNAALDIGGKIAKVPVDFLQTLYDTYRTTPEKIAGGVQSGANDLQKAKFSDLIGFNNPFGGAGFGGNTGKGLTKAALRPAGDFAIAVYAPISAAIGAALNATGGQKLIDDSGKVIADSSGITDIPAFQNYAINHPNAGEDFSRALTLAMAGLDRGQIDPTRMASEAQTIVNKIIPPKAPPTEAFYHGASADTAALIKEGGFRGSQDFPGNNMVSLTGDVKEAGRYATLTSPKGEVLRVEVKGSSVKTYPSMDAYTKAIEKAPGATAGAKETALNAPYDLVRIKVAGQPDVLFANPAKLSVVSSNPTGGNFFDQVTVAKPVGEPVSVKASQPAVEVKVGGPEQAPNTRAVALDKAATAKKLTEGLGELPTHDRMNMVEQSNKANDFITTNPAEALRVAKGESLPPQGVLPESVYTAFEIKAIREGDVALIKELSQSKVPTLAGQSLKALDSVDPNSPVKILRDIQAALETKVEKSTKMKTAEAKKTEAKTIAKEIDNAVKEGSSKRPTWEKFIEDLTCGI